MNTITTANKNRILGGQKQLVNIVCLLKNGTTITLTEANIMENSLVIDRATSYGDTMFIGSATAAQLSFTVADFNGTYETTDFHDARMDVTLCLDISGTRTAVLPMGRFYVLTAKRDLKQIQIVALDQLTLLDSISDRAGSGGFTVTLASILQNVSSKVFGNTTTIDFSAVNSLCTSPSMTKFQYPSGKDVTYHNIVAWVAALTGTIARAHGNGGTGSIQLIRSSASGDTITKATRFSGKCEENDVALTGVFAVDASGKEYSAGSAGYQLNITSNGIFEQAYNQDTNADFRQTLLTRLWSNMGALTVRPFKATTLSYPWLECGDTVTYVDDKGVSHSAIVTHIRFVLNGRMQLDCELPSTEEQTIDTALPPSIKRSTITTEMLRINAIKSLNYVEANGNFSSAGTWFDLARGLIKSKNFAIDANGNAYFKGTITATAGYIGTESNGFAIGSSDLTGTYTVGNESYTIKVETDGTITMRPVTFSTNSTYTSTNLDESTLRMSAYHPDIGFHDQIDIYSSQDGMGIGFFVGNNEITDATTAEEFAINGQHRTSLGGIYASPENGAITTDGKWILSADTYLDGHSGQTLKDWIDAIEASGYVLPAATTSALGGVIVGSNLSVTANGTLSVNTGTIATRSWVNSQGFIKSVAWGDITSKPFVSIGSGLEVDANNILHAKVGNGLKIDSDADNGIAVDLTASDIPSLTASKISNFTSSARSAISATTPISYASSTGKITHATSLNSAVASGLYKIAANTYGHITSATAVAKADITALGIPAQDTTYSAGTGVDISSSHEVSVLYGDGLTLDDGNSIEVDFTTVAKKTDIPTVNNATLTIQRNGTTVKTFTANASSNVTANITVPTKTSELTNDSGFITGVAWSAVTSKPFNTVGDGLEVDTNKILKVKAGNGIKIDSDADNGVAVDLSASDIPTLTSAKISDFDSAVDTALGIGSGSTFLRKDGTWATPTNTTYTGEKGITVSSSNKIGHTSTYTAKSTQAVYPITIDTYGHIASVGNAVTIPTVNNATLTIQKNGSNVATFTANASSNVTANISVPVNVSELTNDSGYLTSVPTAGTNTIGGVKIPASSVISNNSGAIDVKYGTGLDVDNDNNLVIASTVALKTDIKTYTGEKGITVSSANKVGHTNTYTAKSTQAVYPIKIDTYGHISAVGNAVTIPTIPGADRGISLVNSKYGHSNTAIDAVTTQGMYKISFDAYGHIDGYTAIAKADITGLGIPSSDTNTTYSLAVNGTGTNANKLGLTAGGSGSGTTWVTVPYATSAGSAPASDVYAWAKAATKPTYTASEVGALPISGGQMSGNITWTSSSLPQFSGSPTYLLGIEAFASGGATKWANASNVTVGSATNAYDLLAYGGNEVIIGNNSTTAGASTNEVVWINYRDTYGGATNNDATKITDYYFGNRKAGTTGVNVRAATFIGNLTGNVTGNVTGKGTLTLDSVFTVPNNAIITVDPKGVAQSPVPGILWHDILAFCRAAVPTYETSTDGTTWTSATLEKRLFSQQEAWGAATVLSSTIKGSRWTWGNAAGFYASMASWLVLGVTYKNPSAHFDVKMETSSDYGATWTVMGNNPQNMTTVQSPVWIYNPSTMQNSFRLTITWNSASASNASLGLCSIRFLTRRWGDQGKGSEYQYPYSWDGSGNITTLGTINGYTLAGACAKAVDTSISASSTSVNLPTSKAVATFVEGKGYITSIPTATTQAIGGVKVPSGSGLAIGTGNSAGALSLNVGTGLDVDNNNNLIVSLSASNIPTITSAKISDFTSAAKTAIGIASSGSTFLRKDGTWASPTVSSIAWSSVTSKPFTSVNESGGLEVASNDLQVKAGTGLTINSDSGELEVSFGTTATTAAKGNHTHTITAAVTDGVWDLTGTNGTNKVTYAVAPYAASTATSSWITNSSNAGKFYLGANRVPYATTRLNYNGYFYARDVYANGQSVDSRLTALEEQICLIEGTKIAMADGTEKNIEDVKVGDMVLSYNPSTGKQIEAMALQSVRTGVAKDFDVFIFDNGNVAEMFQEHSVYDVNLGYPHSHKEWKVGDVGLMADGEQSALARITTARHAIIKQRYVLCVSTGLYYANGILMGIWSSTKYNIVSRPCYNLNLPDKILNEFKRCGEMNDKANLLEINPDFIKQSKSIQQTIHRLSTEIEEAKKNLLDTDYLVAKFTEGLISTAEWLKSKASRANWRLIVNNNEAPLAEAKEQLENLKARIKGQVPSLKENYWESVAESDKLLPEFKAWYAEWSKENEEIN